MPYFYMKHHRNPYGSSEEEYQTVSAPGTTAVPGTYPYPQDERAPKLVSRAEDGRKFDQGKPDFTLLPWEALESVVRVLEFGLKKYDRDNWKHVSDAYNRYEAAGLRHRVARLKGELVDPESGELHLAHEACCLLFQLWFEATKPSPSSESSGR